MIPIKRFKQYFGIVDNDIVANPINPELIKELKKVRNNQVFKIRDKHFFIKIIDDKMKDIDFYRLKNGN